MKRKEAIDARKENRKPRKLTESDFLLAEYFGLTKGEAAKISADICKTVKKNWGRIAESYGLSSGVVEYMRPAFSLQL